MTLEEAVDIVMQSILYVHVLVYIDNSQVVVAIGKL